MVVLFCQNVLQVVKMVKNRNLVVPGQPTGTQTNSPTAYSKNYHFWQKFSVPRRATPTRIASHGAPQARKQAIWGDLGRYSSQNRLPRARTPPKIASHEVVLRGTISLSTCTPPFVSFLVFHNVFWGAAGEKMTVDSPKIDRWKPTLPFLQCPSS